MGAGNFIDNNCRVVVTRPATVNDTVCLTAAGYTQVIGIRVVNTSPTAVPNVDVKYKKASDGISYFYQANYPLQVTTALWFPFDAFALYEGDQILVKASIACVDVFVFIAEVPGRSQ